MVYEAIKLIANNESIGIVCLLGMWFIINGIISWFIPFFDGKIIYVIKSEGVGKDNLLEYVLWEYKLWIMMRCKDLRF